jgi:hypothetical protein
MAGIETPVRRLRAQIESAMAEGATLTDVEDEILDDVPASTDARDALWLFAWGISERDADPRGVPTLTG